MPRIRIIDNNPRKAHHDIKPSDSAKHFIDYKRVLKQRVKPLDSEFGYAKAWRLMLRSKGVPMRDL